MGTLLTYRKERAMTSFWVPNLRVVNQSAQGHELSPTGTTIDFEWTRQVYRAPPTWRRKSSANTSRWFSSLNARGSVFPTGASAPLGGLCVRGRVASTCLRRSDAYRHPAQAQGCEIYGRRHRLPLRLASVAVIQ
eukprot:scaffold837_cov416-Prasinococcus_capsulatus_cf.AAC.10